MYKIIGTDQKEYGPVSSDQIRTWIAQGRVNSQTRTQAEGGDWKGLGDFPEFASELLNRRPSPPPSSAPPLNPNIATPQQTSGLAIASLVLGILGIFSCGLTALVGLILGIMALSRVRKSNGALGGQGIALAGTIISAVFLLFSVPIGAAMLIPALAHAKEKALAVQCMNNARQLSLVAREYAAKNGNHYPAAVTWCESLQHSGGSETMFKCPAAKSSERCDYAFNVQLDGADINQVNGNTVLFFETDGGWDANGGPELLLARSRHGRAIVVAFADGHVEQVAMTRLATLRWTP